MKTFYEKRIQALMLRSFCRAFAMRGFRSALMITNLSLQEYRNLVGNISHSNTIDWESIDPHGARYQLPIVRKIFSSHALIR
jgi:hypothetical protein